MEETKTKETQVEESKSTEKTFTQAELDQIVKQRLERAQKKADEEKAEAERVAKMTADEKLQEEMKKFEEERQKFQKQQLEYEATKQLADLNVPTEFASFFVGENSEATKQNIDSFNIAFTSAVQAEVDKRLKNVNNAPQNPTNGTESVAIKKAWEYSPIELSAIKAERPELYNKIMNK